jgi:hypothetical protein
VSMSDALRCLSVSGVELVEERVMGKLADEAITARRRRRAEDLAEVAATHAATGNPALFAERRRRLAVAEVSCALRSQHELAICLSMPATAWEAEHPS